MIPEAREVHLSRKDRKVLEACCRSPVTLQRDLKRARIVLLAADGRSTRSIAKEVGVQPRIVSLWRHRYADHGLEGLQDKPRPGKQPIYTKTTDKRILKLLDKPPPQGFARWTGPLLAEALGDVDVQYVWRFLRSHKIDLVARKSWCESNDPNFTAKAADVVGLYVAPPAKAIVLCVDEKPSIQALERAQGYLKLPNGRALTGQSHDYKRHGTTTLFAALEVATGKIIATHSKRRRRVEFLDFMNSVTAAFPNRKLHVILDNLNTHKKNEDWLKAHPNVQFHFTPTSASWLNQVEVWFSILQGQSLSGTSFTSLKQLQEHIDAYVNAYNDRAEPFVWTKKKVRQRRFKRPPYHSALIPGTRATHQRDASHAASGRHGTANPEPRGMARLLLECVASADRGRGRSLAAKSARRGRSVSRPVRLDHQHGLRAVRAASHPAAYHDAPRHHVLSEYRDRLRHRH
ncbi:transposase [Bradyrhizobium diazoefficiens]